MYNCFLRNIVALNGLLSQAGKDGTDGQTAAVSAVKTIISNILWVPALGGVFFALWGTIQLIQALRDDRNPDGMATGGRNIIVGIALIALKIIWVPIGDALF